MARICASSPSSRHGAMEGLRLTKDLGAYQMCSWSSLDRQVNYALKLNLGFAVCPAVYETDSGLKVSGVYFVKTVARLNHAAL